MNKRYRVAVLSRSGVDGRQCIRDEIVEADDSQVTETGVLKFFARSPNQDPRLQWKWNPIIYFAPGYWLKVEEML